MDSISEARERAQFYSTRNIWPDDYAGFVFLGRAIDRIGRARFGELWDGSEPQTIVPMKPATEMRDVISHPTCSPGEAGSGANQLMADLLKRKRAKEGKAFTVAKNKFGIWDALSASEWSEGIEEMDEYINGRNRRYQRGRTVERLIKNSARDGLLTCVLRPVAGGLFSDPLPAAMWNTETYSQRFIYCKMNPDRPFERGHTGPGYQYIFVSDDDLKKLEVEESAKRKEADTSTGLPWERIVQVKETEPNLKKSEIRERFSNWSNLEFDKHWKTADAKRPDLRLSKHGRPKK